MATSNINVIGLDKKPLTNAERQARFRAKRDAKVKAVDTPLPAAPKWVAVGAVTVGGLLLVLSLQHLAHGIVAITGTSMTEALLLAIGIDAGLVVTELAAIVAAPAAAKAIRFYVWSMLSSTLALSAGLNAWAFAQHSEGLMTYASCAFGFFVPLMVFGLSKVAIALTGRH
jgi:hypothetical protein